VQVPQEWFYSDPQGNVQGPFDTESMRQWHEAGYFTPELPVKLRHWVGFHVLRSLFRDADEAFAQNIAMGEPVQGAPQAHPSLVNAQNMEALLRQQQMEQQQRQLQQQRIEEQRRQALLEQQRQQEAAAALAVKQKQEEAARMAEMKRLQTEAEQMELARKAAMAMQQQQQQGQGGQGYGAQAPRPGYDGKAALVYQIAYNKPGPVGLAVAAHGLSYQVAPGQLQGVHVPMVRDVAPGTPIVPGDILLSVNGKPLVRSLPSLFRVVSRLFYVTFFIVMTLPSPPPPCRSPPWRNPREDSVLSISSRPWSTTSPHRGFSASSVAPESMCTKCSRASTSSRQYSATSMPAFSCSAENTQ